MAFNVTRAGIMFLVTSIYTNILYAFWETHMDLACALGPWQGERVRRRRGEEGGGEEEYIVLPVHPSSSTGWAMPPGPSPSLALGPHLLTLGRSQSP